MKSNVITLKNCTVMLERDLAYKDAFNFYVVKDGRQLEGTIMDTECLEALPALKKLGQKLQKKMAAANASN